MRLCPPAGTYWKYRVVIKCIVCDIQEGLIVRVLQGNLA
jgi:hypothetical protein